MWVAYTNKDILEMEGWEIECESPFEIRDKDGNFARGLAAKIVVDKFREDRRNRIGKEAMDELQHIAQLYYRDEENPEYKKRVKQAQDKANTAWGKYVSDIVTDIKRAIPDQDQDMREFDEQIKQAIADGKTGSIVCHASSGSHLHYCLDTNTPTMYFPYIKAIFTTTKDK